MGHQSQMKDCDIAPSVKEEIMQKVLAGVPTEHTLAGEAQAYNCL